MMNDPVSTGRSKIYTYMIKMIELKLGQYLKFMIFLRIFILTLVE